MLTRTGGLFVGNEAGPNSWIAGCLAEADAQRVEHEVLSSADIRRRFPAFDVNDQSVGLYDPSCGVLRPEACITAQLSLAEQLGASVHRNETVVSIEELDDCVVVRTDQSEFQAKRVVVTAGPWVGDFLEGELSHFVKTYRQVLYWFDIANEYENFLPDEFPVFVWQIGASSHDMFYGFPAFRWPRWRLEDRDGPIRLRRFRVP